MQKHEPEGETPLSQLERRLVTQSDALTELTARYVDPSDQFPERLRHILTIAADALKVERLGMWRIDAGLRLARAGMAVRCSGGYETAATIERGDVPAYFAAIETDRVIAAADARTDSRTQEFLDSYLTPNG